MDEKKEPKWRYRLQLLSERHDRVVFSFSMPVLLTVVLAVLLTMAIALFALVIATSTPLKQYLPGYLDMSKRATVVESAMRIDSIAHESNLRSLYLENLRSILLDTKVSTDSLMKYDSAVVRLNDSIQAASDRERNFVASYEERERFGLNALYSNSQLSSNSFIDMVKGKVVLPTDDDDLDVLMGTRLELNREMPVLAPLDATVIMVRYLLGTGYEITLQCVNEYVVIVSHLSDTMVSEGKVLKPGTVIGHAGAEKDADDRWLSIRIWYKGTPVDPLTLMQFK